jgi:ribosomal protein S18 acetylase RimI-like enzyme
MNVTYQIKKAAPGEILIHLKKCSDNFIPPLASKVNLDEYAQKLADRSITFEAWDENNLVGLVATYFNDLENRIAYITNVSVEKEYNGRGIANELVKRCIEYAKEKDFQNIMLEVSENNTGAIQLYKKFKFAIVQQDKGTIKMNLDLN